MIRSLSHMKSASFADSKDDRRNKSSRSTATLEKKQKRTKNVAGPSYPLDKFTNNTYMLMRNRNYLEFLYRIGVENEARHRAINMRPTLRLTRRQNQYTLATSYGDETPCSRVTFELGKPIVRELKNGTPVTSLFAIKDNELIETQCLRDSQIVITRSFHPGRVLVKMSSNNDKCERFYRSVPKTCLDTCSETSRRDSLMRTPSSTTSTSNLSSCKTTTASSEMELINIT